MLRRLGLVRSLSPDVLWLLRAGAMMTGIRAANVLVGLATTVLLARVMGVREYGVYAFYLGWVFILGLPLQMGMPTLVMRQVAIHRRLGEATLLRGVVRFGAAVLAVGALVIATVGGGVAVFFWLRWEAWPTSATTPLLLSSYGLLVLLGVLALLRATLAGFENVVAGGVPDTLIRPMAFLVFVAFIAWDGATDPGQVMLAHCAAAALATVAAGAMAARHFASLGHVEQGGASYRIGPWLRSLWPLTLQSGAATIKSRLDIAMLGVLVGPAAVGLYDVAVKVAGFVTMAQTILNALISPRVARDYAGGDRALVHAMMRRTCRIAFFVAALFFAALLVAGASAIMALFGAGFVDAYPVAVIIGVGQLVSAGFGAVGVLLNMTGNEKVTARVLVASALLNAGLNAVAIPLFGAIGAAAATTATVIFLHWYLWNRARMLTGIRADVLAPHRLQADA